MLSGVVDQTQRIDNRIIHHGGHQPESEPVGLQSGVVVVVVVVVFVKSRMFMHSFVSKVYTNTRA
jgi:hypothetical protein